MDRWIGKVAIVTGASAGIGAAISENLVRKGLIVAGLARRKERVEELAEKLLNESGKLHALKVDIQNEDDILTAFEWVKQNLGPIHILINNAGCVRPTNLTDGDTKLWKEVFDTNVMGLCIATREAVKDMKANNVDGHIIHISSVTGHIVPHFPNVNVYPASKHAVTALTEALRLELIHSESKIKISCISPGLVETEIVKASGAPESPDMWNTVPNLKSEDIVDTVIYVLSTAPHVQVHDIIIRPIGEKF